MNYTLQQLKDQFSKLNYNWYNFHIIGVRSKADLPNVFDDKIYLVIGDKLYSYNATTNPGTYWLQNFMNKKGTAVLKPGQYINTWEIGLHKGVYEALVQIKPVTVFRDSDKDLKSEETDVLDYGLFGINIHRSNETAISKLIDKWSAGCQVFANGPEYKKFIELCKQSKLNFFTYSLLKEF